jgi:hypothetical protein
MGEREEQRDGIQRGENRGKGEREFVRGGYKEGKIEENERGEVLPENNCKNKNNNLNCNLVK